MADKYNLGPSFYSNTASWAKQQLTRSKYNKDLQSLKDKFNNGEITKDVFDTQFAALQKSAYDQFDKDDTNIDKTVKNAAATYTKSVADAQAKLDKKEITEEEYKKLVEDADNAYKGTTGMSYKGQQQVKDAEQQTKQLGANVANAAANAMSVAINGRPEVGVSPDGSSTGLRAQAQEDLRQAGDEQRNAQQNFQIANRNYRDEAGRDAAMQSAAQNAQTINNASAGIGAGAAAMQRQVVTPDTQTYMNRQDTQRREGVENQRTMHAAQQEAIRRNANADNYDYVVDNAQRYNTMSGALSSNNGKSGDAGTKDSDKDVNTNEPADTAELNDSFIKGASSADLRNIQAMIANTQENVNDYKFYPADNATAATSQMSTQAGANTLSKQYTIADIKAQYPNYYSALISLYNNLMGRVQTQKEAMLKYIKDTPGTASYTTMTTVPGMLSDLQVVKDFVSAVENRYTRTNGGTTHNEGRATEGGVGNNTDINVSKVTDNPNITGALTSLYRA